MPPQTAWRFDYRVASGEQLPAEDSSFDVDPPATLGQQLRGGGADRSGADHQLRIHTRSWLRE
jgi:hypothetical protein